jgi:hypothetical protein
MTFLFDLPLFVTGPAILLILLASALGGLALFRRRLLPRLHFGESDAHFSGAMVASIMVFYGLAMALIAVHVWETYEEVAKITSHEASTLAALYRDVSEYPEPARTRLRDGIRDYVGYVIREGWPAQRKGLLIRGGVWRMDVVQSTLMGFEPRTEAQKLLAAETLRAYNLMIEARRLRLDATDTHLPGVMWLVIALGAMISLVSAYFFPVVDPRVHATQVALLATFMGVVIFLVLALDRPFRGDLGLPSTPYQIIYEQLMKR